MSIILFAFLVILLVAMAIWGLGYLLFADPPKSLLYALVVLLGVVAIGHRAGLF